MRAQSLSHVRLFVAHQVPRKNTGVGCHFLLQGVFPTQASNQYLLDLLHGQVGSQCHPGSQIQTQNQAKEYDWQKETWKKCPLKVI